MFKSGELNQNGKIIVLGFLSLGNPNNPPNP